jgi:putrescine transport system substrate-binding protein
MRHPILRGSLAVVAAVTLLGFGVARAETLNIYNWSDYIGSTTLADFTKATGIQTHYDTYDSLEVLEAKLLTGHSGYDITVPTAQPTMARLIKAGALQKLDKSKIPNLKNLDPALMKHVSAADPGNQYGVIYQWGTIGIGVNVNKVKALMPDAPLDSFDLIFKPEVLAKISKCGVTFLDSQIDVFPTVLHYLGLDPNSEKKADLAKAEALLEKVKPYLRYFHSSQYINELASGAVCVSLGYSGDIGQAASRAKDAGKTDKIIYVIPKEGAQLWFDMMTIPKDAPHPDAALKFINFVLEPKVMAGITNTVTYPNAVPASLQYVDDAIKNDPNTYPPPAVMKRMFNVHAVSAAAERERTRAWTRIKTGK